VWTCTYIQHLKNRSRRCGKRAGYITLQFLARARYFSFLQTVQTSSRNLSYSKVTANKPDAACPLIPTYWQVRWATTPTPHAFTVWPVATVALTLNRKVTTCTQLPYTHSPRLTSPSLDVGQRKVTMKITVFWNVTPDTLANRCRCSVGYRIVSTLHSKGEEENVSEL